MENFLLKPWTNLFRNTQILRVSVIDAFIVLKGSFSIWNVTKHFLSAYFN